MTDLISIVVCTYNRAAMLADTLASWRKVRGRDGCRFIVVDNASTDDTRSVVERFNQTAGGDDPIRYVYEGQSGLSFARNRGIEESDTDIVAFVDDDVFFHEGWLEGMSSAFAGRPDVHCVGGMSIPHFEGQEPAWLSERILKFYGSTQSGDEVRPMQFPEHPFGVNMAFRREVFSRVGGFRTDLGRKKHSLLSDEEKEFFYRVAEAGLQVLYTPHAQLYHRVTPERLDPSWLLRRAYWQGVSNVVFDRHVRQHPRGRILKNIYRNLRALLLGSGKRTPASVARYYRRWDLTTRMFRYTQLGMVRQSMVEFLRPNPPHRGQH